MAKTDEVPVFYWDQNDVTERCSFVWLRGECRLKKNILGKFENNGKTFRLFKARPRFYPVTAADLKSSNVVPVAATITNGELLANVGIGGEFGCPVPRHLVKRARQKVRVYQQVRDQRALTAVGRWYASECIQISVTA